MSGNQTASGTYAVSSQSNGISGNNALSGFDQTSFVTIDVPPATTVQAQLQLANVAAVRVFALDCGTMAGTVAIQTATSGWLRIEGPLILYGDAVGLLGSLANLDIRNDDPNNPVQARILLCVDLVP